MGKKTIQKIVNNKFFILFCVVVLLFVFSKVFYTIETVQLTILGNGTQIAVKRKTYYLFGKAIYTKEG